MESGRYRITKPAMFNHHTRLAAGDVVFSDGSKTCDLDGISLPIKQGSGVEDQAQQGLFVEAVTTIQRLIRETPNAMVSPLLPSALISESSSPSQLEALLQQTLDAGHLHHIAQHPRLDLRYDEAITPVSRARRLANGTLKHLASHSECWQRRTLTGVIPRKVLARFSEDDYGIYENRLYARLLDRLERHLRIRLARLIALQDELQQALSFQQAESVHHRLSYAICELWGRTFDPEQTDIQLKASKETRKILEKALRDMQGLKQQGLYPLIPRAVQVSGQVHRTNILGHDPHYRHLPPLWEESQREVQATASKPKDVFAKECELHDAYSDYVGLVMKHALQRYGIDNETLSFQWGNRTVTLIQQGDEWHLNSSDGSNLQLVPWVNYFSLPELTSLPANRVICWTGLDERRQLQCHTSRSGAVPISPLDLYVVERMGYMLDKWLMEQLLNEYKTDIAHFRHCPVCQSLGDVKPQENGFAASCGECGTKWYLNNQGYRQIIEENADFQQVGRRNLDFSIPPPNIKREPIVRHRSRLNSAIA
jgi:hypothetical protein